jgi:hypothetical protein
MGSCRRYSLIGSSISRVDPPGLLPTLAAILGDPGHPAKCEDIAQENGMDIEKWHTDSTANFDGRRDLI